MIIKVVLSIVRSYRLRQRIDMILSKPWNTNNVFQNIFSQKFWIIKVRKTIHQNSLFGGHPCNFASKLKNHHYCTFVSIKVLLSIVRSFRLLQRIDMIQGEPWSTHNVFQKYFFKKILDHQSQEDHPPKFSFWRSIMQFCIKIEKSPLVDLCEN